MMHLHNQKRQDQTCHPERSRRMACHGSTPLTMTLFFFFRIPAAFAAALVDPLCNFPGCGLPPADLIGGVALPELARIALNATAALAVIFGIVGGAQYLLSRGDESQTEKAKQTILWALIGMLVALVSHRVVIAVLSQTYIASGADPLFEFFTAVIYIMTALLNVGFFLMVLWGGMRMVMAKGTEEEVSKGRKTIVYAIVGAVIINVIPFVVKAVIAINP